MPQNTVSPPSSGSPAPTGTMRLNKALAQAGVCSRRAADALIASGRVTVNGNQPEGMGMPVDPIRDDIRLDGAPLPTQNLDAPLYYLLNKPPAVVTTAQDPEGRQTVMDLMGAAGKRGRLFPVGRLDYFSEGLLLLTTDGELANRLMHPSWHLPKVYEVTVRGMPTVQAINTMQAGMTLAEGEKLAPIPVRVAGKSGEDGIVLELKLIQGINRQIRRMCRDLGLTILRLVRVSQGPVQLGDLPRGKYRPLSSQEILDIKAAVGL